MISTLIIVISVLIAIGWLVATRSNAFTPPDKYGDSSLNGKWIIKPIVLVVFGLIIGLVQPFSLERVDAGCVGIKVNLTGDQRGVSKYEYKTGWVTYNTWANGLHEFPTYQQHIDYDTVEVITQGGFAAKIKPSFNYSLISGNVGDMFQNLRLTLPEIEQGWLKNAIIGSVNDVANRWKVDSIFNNREAFETAIITECNKRVSKWFLVSQLRSNIVPPKSLQQAIIEKTNQVTLALAELSKATTAQAAATVKIATARGDSANIVIRAKAAAEAALITAEAEAESMKKKQLQLSPLYVDYIKANNWDGKLPTTIWGGAGNTMFNLK